MIGFCGLTHLGLNSALAAAVKGWEVLCFDPDADRVARLAQGEMPFLEPEFELLFAAHRDKLHFSADPATLTACTLALIAPDVPTDDVGRSDIGPVQRVFDIVNAALPPHAALVILSQVPPGFTRALPRTRQTLFYQVETLIFGRAVRRALEPERTIVGCADPAAPLPSAYQEYLQRFNAPIILMRYESAELAKISINCMLVASVSAANTLAELCEGLGADWAEIAPALRLDARIGPAAYLTPGLGISGGNLERDLATVARLAEGLDADAGVVQAWQVNSAHRKAWAVRILRSALKSGPVPPRLGILGLAYKENTASTKNAPSLGLLQAYADADLRCYDPAVDAAIGAPRVPTPLDACVDADAIALMTPWPEFRQLAPADIAVRMRGRLVVDPYGMLDAPACAAAGLHHYRLGFPFAESAACSL
jgi:UDPglucose 6-dehydrogenase